MMSGAFLSVIVTVVVAVMLYTVLAPRLERRYPDRAMIGVGLVGLAASVGVFVAVFIVTNMAALRRGSEVNTWPGVLVIGLGWLVFGRIILKGLFHR